MAFPTVSAPYGLEAINQLEHALQCANLAELAGETSETIVACLLHDLGHLLAAEREGTVEHDTTEQGNRSADNTAAASRRGSSTCVRAKSVPYGSPRLPCRMPTRLITASPPCINAARLRALKMSASTTSTVGSVMRCLARSRWRQAGR